MSVKSEKTGIFGRGRSYIPKAGASKRTKSISGSGKSYPFSHNNNGRRVTRSADSEKKNSINGDSTKTYSESEVSMNSNETCVEKNLADERGDDVVSSRNQSSEIIVSEIEKAEESEEEEGSELTDSSQPAIFKLTFLRWFHSSEFRWGIVILGIIWALWYLHSEMLAIQAEIKDIKVILRTNEAAPESDPIQMNPFHYVWLAVNLLAMYAWGYPMIQPQN